MIASRSTSLALMIHAALPLAAALHPAVVQAQPGSRAPAQSPAALIAGWPADSRAEITALLDSAAKAGLPIDPLRMKIAEGIAKDAAPATIVNVVRALHGGLHAARQALGVRITDAELVAAAAAVQSGVAPDQLRALRGSIPAERSGTQLFVVLTDLTHRGVPVEEGVAGLTRLARAGAGDAAFAQLRLDVARDVASGVAAQAAMARREREYISRGFAPSGAIFPPPAPYEH
ncbi:MAG TPA: hypothetical protein VHE78_06245 [Gemmatimonadaceae bacterium]|nr:hypothetical protein [Gemmatimonadaceae bacterium]